MLQKDFIEIVEKFGLPYTVNEVTKGVYVYSKYEYELKEKHPRKYGKLYIPYIRVSQFYDSPNYEGHDGLYVRDNGLCGYKSTGTVIRMLKEYMKEDKNRRLIMG